MVRNAVIGLAMMIGLSACVTTTDAPEPLRPSDVPHQFTDLTDGEYAFRRAKSRIEPVAETICRQRAPSSNCDFDIVLDIDRSEPSNAYQSLSSTGRPILTFTVALLDDIANEDEIAFILGHEAAHHIEGHIPQGQATAQQGAILGGILAAALGAGDAGVDFGAQIGATVGWRSFSKDHELEADSLGTIIAARAGYDPVRGAQFFQRIPDPGDKFLGSHPANDDRLATVQRTAAGL